MKGVMYKDGACTSSRIDGNCSVSLVPGVFKQKAGYIAG
jgi:hypothetical protein